MNMKPGRELDALIAEKVFGLEVEWKEGFGSKEVFPVSRLTAIPEYSTDIAAAWLVVEKLKGREPSIAYEGEKYGWEVSLTINHEIFCIYGKSAPHAICLAALKAVS